MTSLVCAFGLLFCRVRVWGASVNQVCAEGPWIGYYDYCYFRTLILALSSDWGNPGECLLHLWELGESDGGGPQDGEGPGLSPLSTGKHGVGSQLGCSEWWRGWRGHFGYCLASLHSVFLFGNLPLFLWGARGACGVRVQTWGWE